MLSAQLLSSLSPGLPWFLPPRSHRVLLLFSWGGISIGNLSSLSSSFWSDPQGLPSVTSLPLFLLNVLVSHWVTWSWTPYWQHEGLWAMLSFKDKCFSSLTIVPWAVGRDRSCTGLFSVNVFLLLKKVSPVHFVVDVLLVFYPLLFMCLYSGTFSIHYGPSNSSLIWDAFDQEKARILTWLCLGITFHFCDFEFLICKQL